MRCKHTAFEIDNHAPLIVSAPGCEPGRTSCSALVEFVDVYPTLCELCALPIPDHVQGTSLVPLLRNPDLSWKKAAFGHWPYRDRTDPGKVILGHTMVTRRHRYTEWRRQATGEVLARDLFDLQQDPDENECIANDPRYAGLVKELAGILESGWEAARPKLAR
jgi:arylsulfatase A-like enzyme